MAEPVVNQRPGRLGQAVAGLPAPVRGWADVVTQTGTDLWANNLMEWAAVLSFYAFLSFLPLLLAVAAVAAYVVDPEWAIRWLTAVVESVVPRGIVDSEQIVTAALAHQGRVGLLGILAWLLGGRRILGALVTALDRVSDVDQRRETVRRRAAVEFALLAGIGVVCVLTVIATPVLVQLWDRALTALQVVVLATGFCVLYAVVPHGPRGPRAVLIGAAAATLLFLTVRTMFLSLLGWIWASFDLLYGPLAVAAVLLLWGWLAGLIVLFGGSLASHIKVMRLQGRSGEEASRRHVAHKQAD